LRLEVVFSKSDARANVGESRARRVAAKDDDGGEAKVSIHIVELHAFSIWEANCAVEVAVTDLVNQALHETRAAKDARAAQVVTARTEGDLQTCA